MVGSNTASSSYAPGPSNSAGLDQVPEQRDVLEAQAESSQAAGDDVPTPISPRSTPAAHQPRANGAGQDVEEGRQAADDVPSPRPSNGADLDQVPVQQDDDPETQVESSSQAASGDVVPSPPSSTPAAQSRANGTGKDVEEGFQAVGDVPSSSFLRRRLRCFWERDVEEQWDYDGKANSRLYLVISLGQSDAAQRIAEAEYKELLNCGPNGQNALHVAALRSKDLAREVLKRQNVVGSNVNLINLRDHSGSTPLHYAASVGVKGVTSFLAEGDTTGEVIFQTGDINLKTDDVNEMCPIHIAASVGAMDAINALVDANDNTSAALTDAKLRTFLHVAVENKQRDVVKFVCRQPWPAFEDIVRSLLTCGEWRPTFKDMKHYIVEFFGGEPRERFNNILNMKDNNGNTALHLAVQKRDESSFRYLVGNRYVDLNKVNNEGFTPLDLASKLKMQYPFASLQNPTEWMIRVLAYSGAYFTARRRDLKFGIAPPNNQEPSTPTPTTDSVLVASALIATVTFAAAFTVPGSYKTGGGPNAGTPELGSHYGFKVFLVADILACYCSVAATFSLAAYGTQAHVDPLVRRRYAKHALWLFHVALKNVIVAFALGITIVMWDISITTTVIVAIAATAFILYGNEALAHDLRLMMVMRRRLGFKWSWNLNPSTSSHLDWNTWRLRSFSATFVVNIFTLCWAYVLIFGLAFFAQKVLNKQ